MEYHHLNYSCEAVDYASSYGRIDVLEWFLNLSIRNRSYKFKYSEYAINSAADRGHVDVLEWFYNLSYQSLQYLHYLNMKEMEDTARLTTNAIPIIPITKLSIDCGFEPLKFIYSKNTIDYASSNGRINTLDWWWSHRSNLKFEYSKVDIAACKRHFDVLDWYFDKYQNYSEFKFKYTSKLVDYASIKLLDWLFDRSTYKNSEKYAKKIKFKYTEEAMFYTIMESRLHIIDWYLDKHATYGLPFKFDEDIVTHLSYLDD